MNCDIDLILEQESINSIDLSKLKIDKNFLNNVNEICDEFLSAKNENDNGILNYISNQLDDKIKLKDYSNRILKQKENEIFDTKTSFIDTRVSKVISDYLSNIFKLEKNNKFFSYQLYFNIIDDNIQLIDNANDNGLEYKTLEVINNLLQKIKTTKSFEEIIACTLVNKDIEPTNWFTINVKKEKNEIFLLLSTCHKNRYRYLETLENIKNILKHKIKNQEIHLYSTIVKSFCNDDVLNGDGIQFIRNGLIISHFSLNEIKHLYITNKDIKDQKIYMARNDKMYLEYIKTNIDNNLIEFEIYKKLYDIKLNENRKKHILKICKNSKEFDKIDKMMNFNDLEKEFNDISTIDINDRFIFEKKFRDKIKEIYLKDYDSYIDDVSKIQYNLHIEIMDLHSKLQQLEPTFNDYSEMWGKYTKMTATIKMIFYIYETYKDKIDLNKYDLSTSLIDEIKNIFNVYEQAIEYENTFNENLSSAENNFKQSIVELIDKIQTSNINIYNIYEKIKKSSLINKED